MGASAFFSQTCSREASPSALASSLVTFPAILRSIYRALILRTSALYIPSSRARAFMASRPLFTLTGSSPSGKYGPRTGSISIDREDGTPSVQTDTPALLTTTSRGVVPHLSRDNVHLTGAIRHIQLPFESL